MEGNRRVNGYRQSFTTPAKIKTLTRAERNENNKHQKTKDIFHKNKYLKIKNKDSENHRLTNNFKGQMMNMMNMMVAKIHRLDMQR